MTAMGRDEARRYAGWLASARVALGVTAMVAPTLPATPWVGAHARLPAVKLLARALGARDLALGLGLVLALRHDGPVRGWVEGGGLADAGDALTTLLSFRSLPRAGRWAVLAASAGAAAAARLLSPAVD